MDLIETALTHKVVTSSHKGRTRYPTLIMLHGRGADENDLLGLAEHLDERLLIISLRAPFPFQFGIGRAWYDVVEVGKPEPRMFAESYQKLVQFLDDIRSGYPVDPGRIYLLGFSMGSMMAYALLLTKPELVAGVVANSGYVPEDTGLAFHWDRLSGKSVFIAHGTVDPVIPVEFSRRSKELFEKTQVDLTYKEYMMGHEISEESLSDMSRWISRRLDTKD